MLQTFWEILDIEPTRDERAIKRAYATRLKVTRPDDDPEAFQRLVMARDWALNFARSPETVEDDSEPEFPTAPLPELTIPVVAADPLPAAPSEGPAEAVPVGPTLEPDPAFAKLCEELDALVQSSLHAQGPGRTDGWSAERWTKLLSDSTVLGIDDRNRFFLRVAQNIQHLIPPCHIVQRDEFAAFQRGRGKSAVVEAIEAECQFTLVGSGFQQNVSPEAAMHYYDWLSVAKSARELLERLKNPSRSYVQPNTSIPLLPEADQPVLLNSVPLRNYYDAVSKSGKWSYSFHFKSLLMPAGELLRTQVKREGFIFLIASFSLVVTCFHFMLYSIFYFIVSALALLVLHLAAAFTYHRSIIQHLGLVVQLADRSGEMIQRYRAAFFQEKLGKTFWMLLLNMIDGGSKLTLIVAATAMLPSTLFISNSDKTVDAIISPNVSTVLELAINSKRVSSEDMLDFFNSLSDALRQADIEPKDRSHRSGDLDHFRNLEYIEKARQSVEATANSGSDLLSPEAKSVVLFSERARKLSIIAETYRLADAEQKTRMEHELTQWLVQMQIASRDVDLQTALWILMPPRTMNRPLLQPADVLRKFIIQYYFFSIDSTAFRENESRSFAVNTGLLGSGLVDQSQKITVAARAMAEMKAIGHLS